MIAIGDDDLCPLSIVEQVDTWADEDLRSHCPIAVQVDLEHRVAADVGA